METARWSSNFTVFNTCHHRLQPQRSSAATVSSSISPSSASSLRSTELTTCSDLDTTVEDVASLEYSGDQRRKTNVIAEEATDCRQPSEPLTDWVYWQRDALNHPECWTKMFAVFHAGQLWLYQYQEATAKSLLVCMVVTHIDVQEKQRVMTLTDVRTEMSVQLYLCDACRFEKWVACIESAIQELPEEAFERLPTRNSTASRYSRKSENFRSSTLSRKDPAIHQRSSLGARCKAVLTELASHWPVKTKKKSVNQQQLNVK